MNRPLHACLLLALLLGGAPRLSAATPVIGAQLFQDTNVRIEDLFRHRDNPPPPPGPEDNPFRIGSINAPLPVPTADGKVPVVVPPAPALSDEAILRQASEKLTFGGMLQVGDRQLLVINQSTYKEGGILTFPLQGKTYYLRIVSITGDSVTLGLNESRLTLHF